jgi:integrase/recombinase XerD
LRKFYLWGRLACGGITGEVAALRYCDVVDADGEIKAETTLSAAQTKGKKARKVWFTEKIRVELTAYVAAHKPKQLTQPLFHTQRSDGFTANTLTHIVNGIYKGAGISGATHTAADALN